MKAAFKVMLVGLLALGQPVGAQDFPIRIDADRSGSVWVRQVDGDPEFKKIADNVPAVYNCPPGRRVDIEIRARAGPFFIYRGQQQNRSGPSRVTIRTQRQPDWPRLLALVALLSAGAIMALRRRSLNLAAAHQQASRRATMAEARGGDPTQIGPYRILERLGQGGMARVYLVEDEHGDHYALKVPENSDERSQREWRTLHRLHHPNIVRLVDFHQSTDPELPSYLVMERVEGETLDEYLRRTGRLPVPQARELLFQLLEALTYAHQNGVIHRDLKPGNLMLTDNGLKLLDFGIAKVADLGLLTRTGEMLGTPVYSAPEQVEAHQVDERCDLYAVGVIGYEMLTGRVPWEDRDIVQLLLKKARGPQQAAHQRNAAVSEQLSEWLNQLMAHQPEQRPASALDALEQLKTL